MDKKLISEMELTETIFSAMTNGNLPNFYEIDFADEGNQIFATNVKTDEHFTITINRD